MDESRSHILTTSTMVEAKFVNFDAVELKVDAAAPPERRVRSDRKQRRQVGVPLTKEEEMERQLRAEKYKRGRGITDEMIESVRDKKVKHSLKRFEQQSQNARNKAAMAEILLEAETG